MRILLLAILLVGAPFMAAETESEPPANSAVPPDFQKESGPIAFLRLSRDR